MFNVFGAETGRTQRARGSDSLSIPLPLFNDLNTLNVLNGLNAGCLAAQRGHDFAREKVEGSLAGVARNARD